MFTLMGRITPSDGETFTPADAEQMRGQTLQVTTPRGARTGLIVEADLEEDNSITLRLEVEGSPDDL